MQSVYSSTLANWANSLGESYPSSEMQSVYSTTPADYAIKMNIRVPVHLWMMIIITPLWYLDKTAAVTTALSAVAAAAAAATAAMCIVIKDDNHFISIPGNENKKQL